MKTKREQKNTNAAQSGNVLIYVLIAIVLFAALNFTFVRQNSSETTSQVDRAKAQTFATEIIGYTAQVKSAIDQMTITGTKTNDLDFSLPNQSRFKIEPHIHKIYHPDGGGLIPYVLPKAIADNNLVPPAGLYLGRFNNTEWTPTDEDDIMMAAYGISKVVCESLNDKITGKTDIPAVLKSPERYFVDATYHTGNLDFNIADCPPCEEKLSLCVSNDDKTVFTFYTIITPR